MDTSARPQRRAAWLTIIAALVVFGGGLVGYELDWIHQRRALLEEDPGLRKPFRTVMMLGDDCQWATEPALGKTIGQRLLALLGEPAKSQVGVYYPIDQAHGADEIKRGFYGGTAIRQLPKVRHAQSLYPEAEIAVFFIAPDLLSAMSKTGT